MKIKLSSEQGQYFVPDFRHTAEFYRSLHPVPRELLPLLQIGAFTPKEPSAVLDADSVPSVSFSAENCGSRVSALGAVLSSQTSSLLRSCAVLDRLL